MKKIVSILLIIVMLGMVVLAETEPFAGLSAMRSAEAEVEIEFETEVSEVPEIETFLAELRQSSVTAEITLQQLNDGAVLRAVATLHMKLLTQDVQTVECWYEIDRTASVPHITVIEKDRNKDTYYELDIHKLPGGIDAAQSFSRALEAVWAQQVTEEEGYQKITLPPENTADILAQWVNLSQTGTGRKTAADFSGAELSMKWKATEIAYQINMQTDVSARQAAMLMGVPNLPTAESCVHINATVKVYGIGNNAVVEMPEILAGQWIDANLLIDKTLFDSSHITVLYNGAIVQFDTQPRLENDTTMVPIRGIMEAAGVPSSQIVYDGDIGKVTIQDEGKTIELFLGSTAAFVNGREIQLLCAAYETEGRTFVPLRFVSEELGFKVEWTGLDQPNGICNGGVVRLER